MGAMTGPGGAAGEASPGSPVEGLIAATRHATQALRQALITTRGIVSHHLMVVPDWRWVIDEGHFLSGPTQALAGRGQLQHSGIAAPLAARPSGCWSRQVGGEAAGAQWGPRPGSSVWVALETAGGKGRGAPAAAKLGVGGSVAASCIGGRGRLRLRLRGQAGPRPRGGLGMLWPTTPHPTPALPRQAQR